MKKLNVEKVIEYCNDVCVSGKVGSGVCACIKAALEAYGSKKEFCDPCIKIATREKQKALNDAKKRSLKNGS